ncbi:MAG: formaldehyde-activating enzyme, partial [Actinomycetota bacterium]|nr:formaldehyde-activating enzyme [Actinomycetota bacterium]
MNVGEGFAGDGANAAHVNTVVGPKEGPVGTAWATALASPSTGHTPFVVVARPNVAVKPMTLFVNKASVASDKHGRLTWGAAQAGVAAGVIDALRAEIVAPDELLIAAVWVNPDADDEEAVFANNRDATRAALEAGHDGR